MNDPKQFATYGAVKVLLRLRFTFKNGKLVRGSSKWGKNRWRKMRIER